MGKKKGQQQRTKGNVLPSSSVRSADLLTKEGANAGLGLFQSLPSAGLGNIPELAGLDSITNVEFRTVLKKLYKRDVTTKLKGLMELAELCQSCKKHEVLTALPYWPRVYNRLFEDADRRVRESTQKAMHAVVNATGKNLALQLKNIIGCWFVSQCDPYAPSALAADASLSLAFSGEKKIEAFVFCRAEILKCITFFLFGPQAKREKLADEEGNNYHRIIASCLEALSLYMLTVSKQKPSSEEIEEILSNSKFWKFQKHGNPTVRGGFYSVVESLCMVCTGLVEAHLSEVCKSIFHRLDECNIAVCKPLYAAAVAVVVKCERWHETVDLQKGVIAGLCNTLKSGCHGLWSFVLPALLPILAKIPNNIDLVAMFSKVLEAMRMCIEHDRVKPSKQGSELAITTFIELLRLSVSRMSKEVEDATLKSSIIWVVVNENLQKVVENSFLGKSNKNTNRLLYKLISGAVYAWETVNLDIQGDHMIVELCDSFWKCVRVTIEKHGMQETSLAPTSLAIQFLAEIVQFQSPAVSKSLKRSVKFEDDASQNIGVDVTEVTGCEKLLLLPRTKCSVRKNVNAIVAECLLCLPWKHSSEMLLLYGKIFENLSNEGLFVRIYDNSCHEEKDDDGDKVTAFVQTVLIPEILRITRQDYDNSVLRTLSIMIFHAARHCRSEDTFPIDLSILIETDVSKNTFAVFLYLLARLVSSSPQDLKIAVWVANLLKDTTNKAWTFLETIADYISSCHCSSCEESKVDIYESWGLLTDILSTTFVARNGEVNSFCTSEGFLIIAKKLFSNMELIKVCSECYCTTLTKTASLMFSCVERSFDVTTVKCDGENIWWELMTDLLRLHCLTTAFENELLTCFADFFSLAMRRDAPFNENDAIVIDKYVAEQAKWMKEVLIDANSDTTTELLPNLKSAIDLVLRMACRQDEVALIVLNNFLPSDEDWEKLGIFQLLMTDLENGDGDACSKIGEMQSFKRLATALGDIAIHIFNTMEDLDCEISWEDQPNVRALALAMTVTAVLSGSVSVAENFLSVFGTKFTASVQNEILRRSLVRGGIWPHCLRLVASVFNETDWDAALQCFHDCCESAEVSMALFQTMLVVVEFLDKLKLRDLLISVLCYIVEADPINLQSSTMYIFCIGVSATRSLDLESRPNFVEKFYNIALKWRVEKVELFLLDSDFDDCTSELIVFNSSVALLFTLAVDLKQESIVENEWDFMRCALMSWMENLATLLESDVPKFLSFSSLLMNSCKFLETVDKFMHSPTASGDPTVPNNLVSEWRDFFSVSINASLVKIFVCLSSVDSPLGLLRDVCRCLTTAVLKSIIQCGSSLRPRLSPESTLPDEVQTILNYLCSLFCDSGANSQRQNLVTVTTFRLIDVILENIVTPGTSGPPDQIFSTVKMATKSVRALFEVPEIAVSKAAPDSEESDEDFGEEDIDLNQSNDAFLDGIADNSTLILKFLLSWKLLVRLTKHIHGDCKQGYIEALMKGSDMNMSDDLLPKLFKLMKGERSHFKTDPGMLAGDGVNLDYIQHTAASLYRDFLVQMPATSRTWFNDLTKAARCRVDRFTSLHVSPVLLEEEFKAIQVTKQQQSVEGMDIIARAGAREVHATYKINEVRMEIAVCLPPNHPLGPITVNTEKRAGVVMGQWRYWLLQITTFLQYQNGGIIDGLLLWKDKVDKRFEGLEECMICFSLAHGSTQSLPKLKCKTCKKKYHAECLYKWFDTSNNSTCPLCRSPMIFR